MNTLTGTKPEAQEAIALEPYINPLALDYLRHIADERLSSGKPFDPEIEDDIRHYIQKHNTRTNTQNANQNWLDDDVAFAVYS